MTISDIKLLQLREFVYRESGISIKDEEVAGAEVRLLRMIKSAGVSTLDVLLQELQASNTILTQRTIEAITVNETSFFRDPKSIDLLCTDVIPQLETDRDKGITLWCAGCSTGQEAYSIAISVLESATELKHRLSIIATDVSPSVIAKAQGGVYSEFELRRGISNELRDKYFKQTTLGWKVRSEVSQMIEFRVANMNKNNHSLPQHFDVVFLRNVMIYFNEDTRMTLIKNIEQRINPDGYLFVGSSERAIPAGTAFKKVNHNECHFYQFNTASN